MAEVVDKLREGDVFRWHYREPGEAQQYGRYHCCSQIGIVKNGRLTDTFWFGGDNRSFGPDSIAALNLTPLGNLADYEKAREYQAEYYDDADIMNLNHSNSTRDNFYLRKGAVRSAAKMLEVAKCKLERSETDERSAVRRQEELRATIARIEAGETDVLL